MYRFLFSLTFAFAVVPCLQLAAQSPRPNILYFFVDDMGWGSIGPNGQAERKAKKLPYVRTPNLDALAARGVNFRRGYACTVCSPSRSSQQSGFHQGHTFADRNDPNNAKKAMRADDILMGDALSAAGYVTGYWGKWGYGGSKTMDNPQIDNVQTLPTSHGYQFVLAELHHVRAHTFFQPTLWQAQAEPNDIGGLRLVPNSMMAYRKNATYPVAPAFQSEEGYPTTGYCDDAYSFAALDFVRTQGQNYNSTGQPFFGLLAAQIPHAPFGEVTKLPNWDQAYADDPHFPSLSKQSQQWAAMVTRIDAHFGNILAALEDPNNDGDTSDSIASNTLVIFQSDNGGPSGKSNEELNANGGLRGNKGKIQEGGIRVPLVMRWPAKIHSKSSLRAGSNTDMVVDVTDLLPTFCDLAGAPTPLGVDGVSIAPTLLSTGHQRHREFIIHEARNGQSIIRGQHKLVRTKKSLELYDLDADPSESHDISVKQEKLVKELETLLLGERVAEPRGFANTYHHWTGENGANATEAKNWSDYTYANSGITYMRDSGSPQRSWIARIENTGTGTNVAMADADMEFLALEIRGNIVQQGVQKLLLADGINLDGRNEIRIESHGQLKVDGGTISSLRWIDIYPGGILEGHGTLATTLFNTGTLALAGPMLIEGDYHETPDSVFNIGLKSKPCRVNGKAVLAGRLRIDIPTGFRPKTGDSRIILQAEKIIGRFANSNDEVVANDGTRFRIHYSNAAVSLAAR